MIRRTLPALLAVCVLFPAAPLAAEPALAIVTGIAPGDLLNVRAAASPVGHTRTRLPNGTAVKNSGCGDFNGYQWCKVEVTDQPGVDGWVPARYLLAIDPEGTATAVLPALDEAAIMAETANASAMAAAPEQGDAGGEKEAPDAPAVQSGNEKADAPLIAVPPDLAARFGDDPAAGPDAERKLAGLTVAESDAYRLAFAARAEATASARPDAVDESQINASEPDVGPANDETLAGKGEGGGAAPRETAAVAAVPTPTPRPAFKDNEPEANAVRADSQDAPQPQVASSALAPDAAPTPAPQIVALADPQSPAPAWDAAGEIPCARYLGQPMTRCQAGVKRAGGGKVDVTVSWPDGGTRIISFYDGKPAGANSRGEFRFTRESGLNMIRLGASERFEITDALAFGD